MLNHSFLKVTLTGIILSTLISGCGVSATPNKVMESAPVPTVATSTMQNEPPTPTILAGAAAAKADSALTLADMLTYALQDEYLAYGEYAWIIRTYDNPRPFSNIIEAEQSHINSLIPLFKTFGLTPPEKPADALLPHPESVSAAVKTGVQAEIDNIAMYDIFLKHDLPTDVRTVFEELKKASQNHLSAFERNANK